MLHELEHPPLAIKNIQKRCQCLLLALSGHPNALSRCLLLGVKQTSPVQSSMSGFDPKRTWSVRALSQCRYFGNRRLQSEQQDACFDVHEKTGNYLPGRGSGA
jgi:hypothetical protein